MEVQVCNEIHRIDVRRKSLFEPYSNRIDLPAMLRIARRAGKAKNKISWTNVTETLYHLASWADHACFAASAASFRTAIPCRLNTLATLLFN